MNEPTEARQALNYYIEDKLYRHLSLDSQVTVKSQGKIWLTELDLETPFGFYEPYAIVLEAE